MSVTVSRPAVFLCAAATVLLQWVPQVLQDPRAVSVPQVLWEPLDCKDPQVQLDLKEPQVPQVL